MISQHPLTFIAVVLPAKLADLQELLQAMAKSPGANSILPFSRIGCIHFGRVVLIDGATTVYLSIEINYDGDIDALLTELLRVAQPGLSRLFAHCEGFTADVRMFIQANQRSVAAFYNGHQGRSRQRILREEALRQAIRDYLDANSAVLSRQSQHEIRQQIQAHISAQPGFEWVRKRMKPAVFSEELRQRWFVLLIGLSLLLVLIGGWPTALFVIIGFFAVLAVVVRGWLAALNKLEETDNPAKLIANPGRVAKLLEQENRTMQNQLTHVAILKPGSLRRRSLKVVLWVIDVLAKVWFNQGRLSGISTIHFARWVFFDNDTRLLFYSNFDGSWESYLGDFTDQASRGLTGIWSNTLNFPKAHNLVSEGARNEQDFKEWVRVHQLPTQVWYSAYPNLSVPNIYNNSQIRAGLFGELSSDALAQWFRRL